MLEKAWKRLKSRISYQFQKLFPQLCLDCYPVYILAKNKASYLKYTIKRNEPLPMVIFRIVAHIAIAAVTVIVTFDDIGDFLGGGDGKGGLLTACIGISLLYGALTALRDYLRKFDTRYSHMERNPGAYVDVDKPFAGVAGEWTKKVLYIKREKEVVYYNDEINAVLRGDKPIDMERNMEYEANLKRHLRDGGLWETVYEPFLKYRHRDAQQNGRQFYNETKFGINSELDCIIEPDHPTVKVHKTCYYDSFLLNIAPGYSLVRNKDDYVIADANDFLAYRVDGEEKVLSKIGATITANEPGVTTLCFTRNDEIVLWSQNRLAQCSTDMRVASGSGSADWEDCRSFLREDNGFRKAIIYGMERELYEESFEADIISKVDFLDHSRGEHVQTRILGYFRWLTKNAKSELVGISRLLDDTLSVSLRANSSEVTGGERIGAETVYLLTGNLASRLHFYDDEHEEMVTSNYSVSCAMAMAMLEDTCRDYCLHKCDNKSCPAKRGGFDYPIGEQTVCRKVPRIVLFEGFESADTVVPFDDRREIAGS